MTMAAVAGNAIVPFLNTPDTQFPYVGNIRGASGVVIAPHWVLSAKHVANNGGFFNLDSGQYTPDYWINADGTNGRPATDLTLLHFPGAFAGYYQPYFGNPVGQTMTMVGYGVSGTLRPDGWGYNITANSNTMRRAGQNKISKLELIPDFVGDAVWMLWYDLDGNGYDTWGDGGPVNGIQEAALGIGDSGGGMFILLNGQQRLVGICAFIDDEVNPYAPANSPDPYYDFGDAGGGTALCMYADWIQSVIGGPLINPSTVQVLQGSQAGGTLSSLFLSDNDRFQVIGDSLQPSPQILLTATSPTGTASQVYFTLETASSRLDMVEQTKLWNYFSNGGAGGWDPNATWTRGVSMADSSITRLAAINPSQLINPISHQLKAQVSLIPASDVAASDGWLAEFDQAVWQVAP